MELLESVGRRLREFFEPTALGALAARLVVNLLVGLSVLLAFYAAWRLLRPILRMVFRRSRLDETTAAFVETLLRYGLLIIGALTALDAAGIKTAPILASVGIAGLTIGFAARDALSNVISGILIYLDRPFTINDLVEIEGQYGRVAKITLRSTRIVTNDGRMLAVPNNQIINNTVASYTNFPHLRLDVAVTVAVTEDLGTVRRVLLETAQGDSAFLTEPPPQVVVVQLNDYNVGLELRVWLDDERAHVEKRLELRERVFIALNRAGVIMPLETIQLAPFEARLVPPVSG